VSSGSLDIEQQQLIGVCGPGGEGFTDGDSAAARAAT